MKKVIIYLIKKYQAIISPYVIRSCRYEPTCSNYAIEAINTYGIAKGMAFSIWRILRCNPFSRGGYDPVIHKENIKQGN